MTHCCPEMRPWEQRATCCHCGKPLADNQLVKDWMITNTTAGWAKNNLRILADMADDNGLPPWYVEEVKRIAEGITLIP